MSNIKEYLEKLSENKEKVIYIEDHKYTLSQLMSKVSMKFDTDLPLDIYDLDINQTLISFFRALDCENTVLLYDSKGLESFSYLSIDDEKVFDGEISAPLNCFVFRTSGSTGKPKYVFHDKEKSIKKVLQNNNSKKNNNPTLVMLHHGHIAWWESVLTELLNPKTLYITNGFPIEGKTYESPLVVRTTPSYLRLCFNKGYFHDGLDYSFFLGSEPMTDKLERKIQELNLKFFQVYGSTELWGLTSILQENSIGIEFSHIDFEIKENVLWIKNWEYIYDYILQNDEILNKPVEFNTHDVVELEDNKIHIIGRTQDYINVGGKKFHTSEIREELNKLSFIEDSFVFPISNVLLGQVVGVEVIVNDIPKDFKDLIRNTFSQKEKKPVHIKVVEDFERASSKKIARKV